MKLFIAALLGIAVVGVTGCGGSSTSSPNTVSYRFLNGSRATAAECVLNGHVSSGSVAGAGLSAAMSGVPRDVVPEATVNYTDEFGSHFVYHPVIRQEGSSASKAWLVLSGSYADSVLTAFPYSKPTAPNAVLLNFLYSAPINDPPSAVPMKLVLIDAASGLVLRDLITNIKFDAAFPVLKVEFVPPSASTKFRLVAANGETVKTFFEKKLSAGSVYTLVHCLNQTQNRATVVLEQPPLP
jgi:hypothetical protein